MSSKRTKRFFLGSGAILSLALTPFSYGQIQGLPDLGGSNSPIQNGGQNIGGQIQGSIGSQIQNSLNVTPPSLNNSLQPNINISNRLSNALGSSLSTSLSDGFDGAFSNTLDNVIKNRANLSLGSLGADISQALNLNGNGDIGASLNGLTVENVVNGSLAQRIGLKAGDKILAVNKAWVNSQGDMTSKLQASIADEGSAWIYVDREGGKEWVRMNPADLSKPRVGIQLDAQENGVAVFKVTPDSPAAKAGLKAGDQIVSVNGKAVAGNDDVISSVQAAAKNGEQVKFQVRRNGEVMDITSDVNVPGRVDSENRVLVDAHSETNAMIKQFAEISAGANSMTEAQKKATLKAMADLEGRIAAAAENGGEQLVSRKTEIADQVTELRATVEEMAKGQSGETREKLQDLSGRLESMVERVRGNAENRADSATSKAENVMSNVKQSAFARMDRVKESINNWKQSIDGEAKEKLTQFETRFDSLNEEMQSVLNNGDATDEQIADLRSSLVATQEAYVDFAESATVDAADSTAEIDAMGSLLVDNRMALDTFIQSNFDNNEDWQKYLEGNLDGQVESTVEAATQVGADADVSEDVQQVVGDLKQRAENYREMTDEQLTEWKSDLGEQRAAINERVRNATGEERELLQNFRDSISKMRTDVGEYQRAKRTAAGKTAADVRSDLSAKVQSTREQLTSMSGEVQGEAKQQFDAFRNDFEEKFSDFKGEVTEDRAAQAQADLKAMTETHSEFIANAKAQSEGWSESFTKTFNNLKTDADTAVEAQQYTKVTGEAESATATANGAIDATGKASAEAAGNLKSSANGSVEGATEAAAKAKADAAAKASGAINGATEKATGTTGSASGAIKGSGSVNGSGSGGVSGSGLNGAAGGSGSGGLSGAAGAGGVLGGGN